MAQLTPEQEDLISPRPTEMAEQAFALMRSLTVSEMAPAVIGPVPFLLGVGFFWSDLSQSAARWTAAAPWAAGLTLLYAWMKVWQALHARAMWRKLFPAAAESLPRLTFFEFLRRTAALWLITAPSLVVMIVSAILLVPAAWAYALFQNATVLAYTIESGKGSFTSLLTTSLRLSHDRAKANHLLLGLLFGFGAVLWFNSFVLCAAVPVLINIFTGWENDFVLNPQSAITSTIFILTTFGFAWLAASPFFRASYVLRVFYSQSRLSGADLPARLASAAQPFSSAVIAGFAALLLVGWTAPQAFAEENVAEAAPAVITTTQSNEEAQRFKDKITETLAAREYQWRLPAPDEKSAKTTASSPSWVQTMIDSIKGFFRDLDITVRKVMDWFFKGRTPPTLPKGSGSSISGSSLQGVAWAILIVLLALLLFFGIRALVRSRLAPARGSVAGGGGAEAAPVDLQSEETLASQLPEDQWLALARQQMAVGDFRLAIRALFLASLATLGEQRLVQITRSKSNRDYRRELGIRARSRGQLQQVFGSAVGIFEKVWYGQYPADHDLAHELEHYYISLKPGAEIQSQPPALPPSLPQPPPTLPTTQAPPPLPPSVA